MGKAYGIALLSAVALSCTPDPLDVSKETGTNTDNSTSNNQTIPTTGTFTAEFVEVTGILTTHCTQPACHGELAANAFNVPTSENATPAEMQTALSGITATSGLLLIAPSNPDGSELWIRMTLPTADPKFMPSTKEVLEQDEYDAIERWITNGAIYTN